MTNHRRGALNGWRVLLDFDGTISRRDVSDFLVQRYAPEDWKRIKQVYLSGVFHTGSAVRLFKSVRLPPERLLESIGRKIRMTAGFSGFAAYCRARGVRHSIVSGGIDFYIDFLLRRWKCGRIPKKCGRLQRKGYRVLFVGDGFTDKKAAEAADAAFACKKLREITRGNPNIRPFRSFRTIQAFLAAEVERPQ